MSERERGLGVKKEELLIARNREHYEELKKLVGKSDSLVHQTKNGEVQLTYISGEGFEIRPHFQVTFYQGSLIKERYHIYDIGLVYVSIRGPVKVTTKLGMNLESKRGRAVRMIAREEGYTEKFCSQSELIVNRVKQLIGDQENVSDKKS